MSAPLFQVIVCAALKRTDGRILVMRRAPGKKMAGFWEFPGGKLEKDEECENALARELSEELGIAAGRCDLIHAKAHTYPHASVLILFYVCSEFSGEIQMRDHDALEWLLPHELKSFSGLLPANQEVISKLVEAYPLMA